MVLDLRAILDGWEYEPGKISVRKIIGRDGREKIQTRVDLGVLQLELVGRPDGERPHECANLLEHMEGRLDEHIRRHGSDAGFALSTLECKELRYEAHLYYQRYLSLFVLEDFGDVERDTAQNLRLIDFAERYADDEGDAESFTSQRAYVVMMHTRAAVYGALHEEDCEAAFELVELGVSRIQELADEDDSADEDPPPEVGMLHELRAEILEKMPPNALPRLNWELQEAVTHEDYERAAELRDRLSRLPAAGEDADGLPPEASEND